MIGLALSPEQFQTLLRMVYIANTVVNGHRDDEGLLKEYEELEQYIFARAKETGFPAATWKHEAEGGEVHHHPSVAFERDIEVNALLDEYEAIVVFEVLAERLALRAIEEKMGPDAKKKLPSKDFDELLQNEVEEYRDLLVERGYDRINIELT
jgi:hypothetical protein